MGIEHFLELFVELVVVAANDEGFCFATVVLESSNRAAKVVHCSESPLIDQPPCDKLVDDLNVSFGFGPRSCIEMLLRFRCHFIDLLTMSQPSPAPSF
jgi:hypothetical protein